jgi:hypothetical protein
MSTCPGRIASDSRFDTIQKGCARENTFVHEFKLIRAGETVLVRDDCAVPVRAGNLDKRFLIYASAGLVGLSTGRWSPTGVESSLRTVERDWAFARAWLEDAIGTG